MPKKSKLLNDDLISFAEEELKNLGRYGVVTRRLQAIIAAGDHGIKKVADIYGISEFTLFSWIGKLRTKNIDELFPQPKKPRKSKISPNHHTIIKEWIENNPNITIKEMNLVIKERLNIEVGKSTVHRLMKKLGYSHITARPNHYKQDKEEKDNFKKNLERN